MRAHLQNGELILHGTVGDIFFDEEGFGAGDVRDAIAGSSGPLTVRLNSGGGIATEGAAIYAVLSEYPDQLTIYVEGIAASAASLLAMAGDEVVINQGSVMMIHDPAGLTMGDAAEHQKQINVLNTLGDEYARVYAAKTGKTAEEMRAVMREEVWLGSVEAVEAGFADRVEAMEEEDQMVARFPYQKYSSAPDRLVAMAREKGWHADCPLPNRAAQLAEKKEAIMADKKDAADMKTPEVAVKEKAPEPDPKAIAMIAAQDRREAVMSIAGDRLTSSQVEKIVKEEADPAAAKMAAVDLICEARMKDEPTPTKPSAVITEDGQDRFAKGAELGIMARAGIKGGERNEFTGMSLLEIARHSMNVTGKAPKATSKLEAAGMAFAARMAASHSTSDFPAVLENIATKSMMRGFEEQQETFEAWTSVGSLPDFKTAKRVGLDAFPSLAEVNEDAEYSYATFGDFAEPVVLATYGKLFSITRQAIINDDLSAFTMIPMKMGRAARRTVGNLAYAVLTGNPNMADGTALFASGHGNLAGSGAAPSVTTMEAAVAAMATQTDRSGNATALNIRPTTVIAPYALRGTIMQLLESEYDPAKSTRAANTVRNLVEPVFDARLDADSATAWYLAASPSAMETVEISYLDGNSTPFLDTKEGWSVDGAQFKVRIDAGAKAIAWEGLYKNAGA